jgi:cation diffusion facilitator family transporter
MSSETRRTVLVAGAANLFIALAKVAAGLISGSSAMLAEGAHSIADTVNQGFLLVSLRTGARPADEEHPFGHGQERYFWSLLAAVGIFVAGAGFSIYDGILSIVTGRHSGGLLIPYIVLGLSLIAEGTSLTRATRQLHGEATDRRRRLFDHIERSKDTTVKAAFFEDVAAVVGLLIAAAGLSLEALTGSPVWDGGASIVIGLLLVVVAFRLGNDSKDGLIGQAADPDEQGVIREEIESTPGIAKIVELQTMHMGPDSLIVAARVAFSDGISADRAEDIAGDIDDRLRDKLPLMPHVFIDPTQTDPHPRQRNQS